ncbi:MAG TPA: hypothetical protein VLQ80_11220, partial [Candidatus Saccharimonadia bacterium]|nr:hypothetical protein [Candidatus Saccharimonadia bacterium]
MARSRIHLPDHVEPFDHRLAPWLTLEREGKERRKVASEPRVPGAHGIDFPPFLQAVTFLAQRDGLPEIGRTELLKQGGQGRLG